MNKYTSHFGYIKTTEANKIKQDKQIKTLIKQTKHITTIKTYDGISPTNIIGR